MQNTQNQPKSNDPKASTSKDQNLNKAAGTCTDDKSKDKSSSCSTDKK
jgi:hypothetical protein